MSKELKIIYLKGAVKFLKKNNQITEQQVDELVIKLVKKHIYFEDQNVDYKVLRGQLKNYFRIRKGSIRIIVSVVEDQVTVEAVVETIGFRGDIYRQ